MPHLMEPLNGSCNNRTMKMSHAVPMMSSAVVAVVAVVAVAAVAAVVAVAAVAAVAAVVAVVVIFFHTFHYPLMVLNLDFLKAPAWDWFQELSIFYKLQTSQ